MAAQKCGWLYQLNLRFASHRCTHIAPMSTLLRLTCVLLVLGLSTFLLGQGAPQAAPTRVSGPDTYSQEAFVLEQMSAKLAFESDGTFTREDFGRIRIQSDAGVRTYQVLTFPYANSESTLQIDFVRVRKHDGTEVDTPLENIQDMPSEVTRQAPFYSDVREKHVAVKGLGTGDVLEFKTHLTSTKPLAAGKFWFAYNFTDSLISLDEQVEISVPSKSEIKIASARVKPDISESGKYRIYRWHYSNLHQKPKEDQQFATYYQARGRLPEPDLQISNFQTWDEVGRWYNDLQRDRVKPTPEIQAKAAQLTKDASDDTARLQAIYKYVSTEFHYIGIAFGIGRYQPHAASEVLANQYGDCKDKHTLLASLLGAAGFKVYPALISASHEINPEVPSPSQFDHVITVVQRGNDLLWLDSTPEVAPFGYLITPLRDKQALVIYSDKPAVLVTSPADPLAKSSSLFEIKAKLNDSGVLEGQIEHIISGDDSEVLLRTAFRRTPFPQWKDLVQQISYASGFAGDVSETSVSSPDALNVPFHFSYKYSRKDFPDWADRKISSPLPPATLPTLGDEEKKLSAPLWLGVPGEHKYVSEVEVPKGYSAGVPAGVDIDRDFAEYHSSYTFKDGTLTTTRRFVVKLREVPASEYEQYKTFSKAVADDRDVYVPLWSGKRPAMESYQEEIWKLPYSANADAARAYDEAREEYTRQDFQAEIGSLNKAVAIDPKFTRAWLWLGEIYKSRGQQDLALQAYRKAIEIDPQLPVGYKALGTLLSATKKFDEAIPVWKKLIEIAPHDSSGFANLGFVYLRQKNYKDALSQFEAAAKLQPDQPGWQMQVGISYLHTGSEDSAVDSFKKAMELDSGANTLNAVAYELANANIRLSEALQYAEKAVHSAEEDSSKIQVNTLRIEDLGQMPRLSAYWDTLGWAYFRMQNYDKAAKYLSAAWNLTLGGVEADHLAQVYEQQHKKYAIHMYQMALAAGGAQMQPVSDPSETKTRLKRLSGTDSFPTNSVVNDFNEMRTFKLPRLVEGSASAEFFLLFSPQDKPPGFTLDDVKFISGSDKLKPAVKILKVTNFKVQFPDNGPAHIIRRGVLGCYQYTGCSIVLFTPNSVRSVN